MTAEHVADESVVELAAGEGSAREHEHASACAECARRVRDAQEALALLQSADVPEPSPLYWEALRSEVRRRIAEERRRASAWTLLVPLAAAAALVAVLWGGSPRQPQLAPPPLPAWSPLPEADTDEGLQVLEGLAAGARDEGDWDEPSGLAPYLASLTDEESRTLAESLRGRAEGGES